MSSAKVILVDPDRAGGVEWAEAGIRDCLPGAEIMVIRDGGGAARLRRALKEAGSAEYAHSVLPFRYRFLASPRYWLQLFVLVFGARGTIRLAGVDGRLMSFGDAAREVARNTLPLQPLLTVVVLLRSPIALLREVFAKFLLSREDPAEPDVGFGAGKGVGGLVYWLNLTRKARRYG